MRNQFLCFIRDRVINQSITLAIVVMLVLVPAAQGAEGGTSGIHTEVMHLGVGHKAKLVLKDGGKEKGTIIAIDEASFSLDRGSKGGVTAVSYDSVKEIHREGLSKGAKIGIVVAVVVVAAVGIVALVIRSRLKVI